MSDPPETLVAMVYITHVRFGGGGSAPENIIMLRWREAMGDPNVADMIEWIEGGGIAKVTDGAAELFGTELGGGK